MSCESGESFAKRTKVGEGDCVEKNGYEGEQLLTNLKECKNVLKTTEKTLSALLEEIQHLLGNEQYELLKFNFDDQALRSFQDELLLENELPNILRYSQDLRKFAVSLYFYSTEAYEHVKKYIKLPPEGSILQWSTSLNCGAGYMAEVVDFLKRAKDKKPDMKDCVISFGSMPVRKDLIYDATEGLDFGYVDCGGFQAEDDNTYASESLMLVVSGLRGYWKYPLAYFLHDCMPARIQARLIREAIVHLSDAGFKVHALVCNGLFPNALIAFKLGCNLSPDNLCCSFPHPADPSSEVYLVFDVAHAAEYVKNCWRERSVLCHNGEKILWQYISELHKAVVKETETTENQKFTKFPEFMLRTRLTAKSLSVNAADTIDFLRDEMKWPEFTGSEKTTEFMRTMCQLFSILASMNPLSKEFRKPLSVDNYKEKEEWLMRTANYIKNLTDVNGTKLTESKWKATWRTLLCTIQSVLGLSHRLLYRAEDPFKFVLTDRLSLNPLRVLFQDIQGHSGWRDPNCLQLKKALQAVMQENGVALSVNANNIDVRVQKPMNLVFRKDDPSQAADDSLDEVRQLSRHLMKPTYWQEPALMQSAGHIASHITKKSKCPRCAVALYRDFDESDLEIVTCDSLGTYPKDTRRRHSDIYKIVDCTAAALRRALISPVHMKPAQSLHEILHRVQGEVVHEMRPVVFKDLFDHIWDVDLEISDDHITQIIKETVKVLFASIMDQRDYQYFKWHASNFGFDKVPQSCFISCVLQTLQKGHDYL